MHRGRHGSLPCFLHPLGIILYSVPIAPSASLQGTKNTLFPWIGLVVFRPPVGCLSTELRRDKVLHLRHI